jgi:hypothetical protein
MNNANGVGRIGCDIDDFRVARLHCADDRRVIDRGRRVGAVIDDLQSGRLGVLAGPVGGIARELGVGGDDGDGLRLWRLRHCQIEIAFGESLDRVRPEDQH